MKYKIIIAIVLIFTYSYSYANAVQEKGYRIEVDVPFMKGHIAYFANYWKGNSYIVDSAQVTKDGNVVFSKPDKLSPGQYLLYIKPDIQVELLIDDAGYHNIKVGLDKDLPKSTIAGSEDSRLFWAYLEKYGKLNDKLQSLAAKIEAEADEPVKQKIIERYLSVRKEIEELTNRAISGHQGSWFGTFLRAAQSVRLPFLVPENEREELENRRFIKDHFFDNIDFTDVRLWNTSFFIPKLETYLNEVIVQHPDTVAKASSWIVGQTTGNDKAFELMLSHLVNEATTSKIMGSENVWAKLAEDYIFNKNLGWIDSIQYNNLLAEYSQIEKNRIGLKAQNIKLQTIDGDAIDTNNIEAGYTILYFYSPACSHCDHEIAVLRKEFFPKYKDKGLKVVAINLDGNTDAWKHFVEKHDMDTEGWTNLFDPDFKSEYWLKYDVSGTPSLYLLGKDKTILAKKINAATLDKYFERIAN